MLANFAVFKPLQTGYCSLIFKSDFHRGYSVKHLFFGILFLLATPLALAHKSMCDHRHNPDGTVTWDCNSVPSKVHMTSDEHNHVMAKHGMILIGDEKVFASHIVYKVPHNFQVILEVHFSSEIKEKYLSAKSSEPAKLFILVLDSMDIKNIGQQAEITGTIYSEDKDGNRKEIAPGVRLKRDEFSVLYFDELPLSLESKAEAKKSFIETGFADWESPEEAESRATDSANQKCYPSDAARVSSWSYRYYGRQGGPYNTMTATAEFACSKKSVNAEFR